MARSPLTLAASVTAALPRTDVVAVAPLGENAQGRYDAAVADLADGQRVVVRVPLGEESATELAAHARALRALTAGVRALLPFAAPTALGETEFDGARAVVVDFLDGFRIDAADLPAGRGAATSIGEAIAAVHSLPVSVVRDAGLPVRTPAHVRDETHRLVQRAEATGRLPGALAGRWRGAIDTDAVWTFESTVVLGGVEASAFLFTDDPQRGPVVTGVLEWHGFGAGDPATDLRFLASAPDAARTVREAYAAAAHRAPDGHAHSRARLYAELEFARWLLHGVEQGRDDVIRDALELLTSLARTTHDDDLVPAGNAGVDDAIALIGTVSAGAASNGTVDAPAESAPETGGRGGIAMETDAYDPEAFRRWERDGDGGDSGDDLDTADVFEEPDGGVPTAPIDLGSFSGTRDQTVRRDQTGPALPEQYETDDVDEAVRASRAALRRWAQS